MDRILRIVAVSCLAACSTPGPLPENIAAAELPAAAQLTPAERERLDMHVRAGIRDLELRDHHGAADQAGRALAIDGRAARAWAIAGRARQLLASFEQPPSLDEMHRAEGELRRASGLAPADPVVARLHAEVLRSTGHLTAAVQRAEAGLEAAPNDADLVAVAASLRYDLGDERRAIPHFERLLDLNPDTADAYYRLGECLVTVARSSIDEEAKRRAAEAARAAYRTYTEREPSDPDGFFGVALAESLVDGAEFDAERALAALRRAATLDALSPRADFNRGVILDRVGEPERAREAYRAALTRDRDHLPSILNLAANAAAAGLDDDARELCRRALELDVPSRERRRLERYLRDEGATRR